MADRDTVFFEIRAERERQVREESFTAEHDDKHTAAELARAAACYTLEASSVNIDGIDGLPVFWPRSWLARWWKPAKEPRRNLVKAAALIAAEIERLDRAEARERQS